MSTKFTYFIHVLAIILTITTRSVVTEPTAPLLYLDEFPKKAICNNLLSASKRINDISLTKCIEYCENLSLEECKMINYFNFWKTDVDSRCYIFNELCSMSKNLENSINSSQIWYKNQFTQEYCVDYRNYLDNVGDSCSHYTDYKWCSNNQITDTKNIEDFEQLKSEFSAIDACCDCGGGKLAVDGVSISYTNDINNNSLECSFKEEQHNLAAFGLTNIRKWNNFAAFDLSQYINEHLPSTTEEYFNSDLLIYNEFKLDTILNNYSSITMCDFQNYVYQDSMNTTNDFFIMMAINDNTFQLFLNSEFFDFNEHILYQTVEVSNYKYCLQQIETSNKNNGHINGILPCWNQYTHPTPLPTYQPTQIPETVETKPSELPVYVYIIIGLSLPICIVAAIVANNRINSIMVPKDKGAESGIIELETHKYSDDHFAIHPLKKNIIPTSTSFLISSSNVLDDEKEPMLMNEENKERTLTGLLEPGSEGYFEEVVIHKQHKKHGGKLICQKQYYDEKQMKYINYEYSKTINSGEFAYILFGDNDMDRQRSNKRNRAHFGGQAGIMGKYDRRFAYGIITTFMKQTPNLERFKSVIDSLFVPLQNHLSCGYDVVYTYPSERDLRTHRNRYYFDGKQIIYHNIGTGIAFLSLTLHHIQYIQFKLKELEKFASEKMFVDYYFMNPTKNKNLTVYNPIQNNNEMHIGIEMTDEKKEEKDDIPMIYVCPSCGLNKHYLMKFSNCNHRMCEECLRGYICYDMQYDQENDRDRFKCYAHILNKCNGYLCIDDIKYPINRCKCDECLKNNTDSGNGTILSDDNYNQFQNILASFDVKLKIWNKDICPNDKCRKPFVVKKPFEMVENKICQQSMEIITNDIRKEFDHCNCCGKYRNNPIVYIGTGIDYGVDEIKIDDNICMVCNFWNCDECRNNCFYKVDTNFTQEPSKQILDAFVRYNQNKMKCDNESKTDIYSLDNEFKICEMCWYNYYCHICPHCNYIFCGKCDIKWEGNTINWFDNVCKHDGIIKKNHNKSHKHKCIKQKEKLQKQEKHKSYIRINEHRKKLQKLNLENQKKSECIFEKEAENFQLKQKIENMEQKMVELKIENQQKENMILSKHLTITTKQKEEVEEKLRESKYQIVWQWFDNNNIWNAFNKQHTNNIENLKIGQIYKFSLTNNKQKYTIHKLSKDTGEQINCKTNFKRKLRKIKIEKHMNGIIYPDFWQYYICDKEQKEGYYMTPGSGSGNSSNDNDYTTPKLIELNLKNNKIAKRVSNEFYSTAAKTNKIIKIESVQNRYLWDKYYTQKESMKKSNGLNKLNESTLWHGTHITVMDKIIKQGFRKEFNTTHKFGEGTYFAVNADYSLSYCKSDNNIYKMFQCLVLCGESAVGSKQITLRNWPTKKSGSGQIVDSLVNSIKNTAIFVIHDDVRVYPMFIVHYTRS